MREGLAIAAALLCTLTHSITKRKVDCPFRQESTGVSVHGVKCARSGVHGVTCAWSDVGQIGAGSGCRCVSSVLRELLN